MNHRTIVLISTTVFTLFSCKPPGETEGDFQLLPLPRLAEFTGVSALRAEDILCCFSPDGTGLPVLGPYLTDIEPVEKRSGAQVIFGIDETMDVKAEGYALDIKKKRISITAKDRAGLLYGFMTLDQLMEDAAEQGVPMPLCHIEDFPQLSYRAIHLDLKHHREKTEYYYKLLNKLAGYKINAIIAEMEDKLAYESQPVVGSADAFSISQWKDLSEYAMQRNIEISPLIQGLGHASFILKHDEYKDLRDDPGIDWAFNPLDPRTYEVQFDLYLDALEATPHGRFLHVGGDEVHTTGRGSGKSPLELQLLWLDKVCKFAGEHGRIPIFWDDMPLKHAGLYRPMFAPDHTREEIDRLWEEHEHKLLEFLDMFPKNCIYMRWNYSHPQAEGNIKAMEWFSEHGLKVMGATAGQTRWILMPQDESNMENISSFAGTSIEKGLDGLLLTLWDDDSPHFELYMRGILAFSEYSWSGNRRSMEEIKSAYRHREFSAALSGDEFAFVDQLEQGVGWWNGALLKRDRRVLTTRLDDPLEEGLISLPEKDAKGVWSRKHAKRIEMAAKVLEDCDEVASRIASVKSLANRNHYRLEVYEQVNELVRFPAEALLILNAFDQAEDEEGEARALEQIRDLSGNFQTLRQRFEEVYGRTRILVKPEGYLLDQDHHNHLANQAVSFDWQFMAELLFLEKIGREF